MFFENRSFEEMLSLAKIYQSHQVCQSQRTISLQETRGGQAISFGLNDEAEKIQILLDYFERIYPGYVFTDGNSVLDTFKIIDKISDATYHRICLMGNTALILDTVPPERSPYIAGQILKHINSYPAGTIFCPGQLARYFVQHCGFNIGAYQRMLQRLTDTELEYVQGWKIIKRQK